MTQVMYGLDLWSGTPEWKQNQSTQDPHHCIYTQDLNPDQDQLPNGQDPDPGFLIIKTYDSALKTETQTSIFKTVM